MSGTPPFTTPKRLCSRQSSGASSRTSPNCALDVICDEVTPTTRVEYVTDDAGTHTLTPVTFLPSPCFVSDAPETDASWTPQQAKLHGIASACLGVFWEFTHRATSPGRVRKETSLPFYVTGRSSGTAPVTVVFPNQCDLKDMSIHLRGPFPSMENASAHAKDKGWVYLPFSMFPHDPSQHHWLCCMTASAKLDTLQLYWRTMFKAKVEGLPLYMHSMFPPLRAGDLKSTLYGWTDKAPDV